MVKTKSGQKQGPGNYVWSKQNLDRSKDLPSCGCPVPRSGAPRDQEQTCKKTIALTEITPWPSRLRGRLVGCLGQCPPESHWWVPRARSSPQVKATQVKSSQVKSSQVLTLLPHSPSLALALALAHILPHPVHMRAPPLWVVGALVQSPLPSHPTACHPLMGSLARVHALSPSHERMPSLDGFVGAYLACSFFFFSFVQGFHKESIGSILSVASPSGVLAHGEILRLLYAIAERRPVRQGPSIY